MFTYRRELKHIGFGGNKVVNRIASPRIVPPRVFSAILCHDGPSCSALARMKTPGRKWHTIVKTMRMEAGLETDFHTRELGNFCHC